MVYEMFSIFDTKVQAFHQPMFFRSKGECLRALGDAVNDPKSDLGRHAADYVLHRVGNWDDTNGVLQSRIEPILVCNELVIGPSGTAVG